MLPLIENNVSITKQLFMEWSKSSQDAHYKKILKNFSIAALVIIAAAFGIFYSIGMPSILVIGDFLFILVIYVWIVFFLPHSRVKSKYKALCQSANGTPKRISRFYQNSFSVTTEAGKVTEFSYDKVQTLKETEHLFILTIDDADIDIILDKNGFRKGDISQLQNLLSSQGWHQ